MLCAFLFFINHPMVKVKEKIEVKTKYRKFSFNHPMVKVKDDGFALGIPTITGFNHPMVKVKGSNRTFLQHS